MTISFRFAREQDLWVLAAVEDEADGLLIERFHPDQWWPASSRHERAAVPGFLLVAVEPAEAVVGFVHVLEEGGTAHLEQLSVRPAYARRGLGRALVGAAKAEAARRGHGELTLRTYADVPWNAPFYETLGFRRSEPATAFHRRLLDVEADLGLTRFGHRVQMTAFLEPTPPVGPASSSGPGSPDPASGPESSC